MCIRDRGYIMKTEYDDTFKDKLLTKMVDDFDDDSDLDDDEDTKVTDPEFCTNNRVCTRVSWHPRGQHFAIPCDDKSVKIFNIKDYLPIKTLINSSIAASNFIDLKFDPLHGNYIAGVDLNNQVNVWNWETSTVHYTKKLKEQVTNIVWRVQPDGKSLDLILGTWTGSIVTVQSVAESIKLTTSMQNLDESTDKSTVKNNLFVDSDSDNADSIPSHQTPNLVDGEAHEDDDVDIHNSDTENLFTQENIENKEAKRKYVFEDEGDDFIDDDDGAGYVQAKRPHLSNGKIVRGNNRSQPTYSATRFRYKPVSPGGTPFGNSDRRYLTMNNVGYVCTVRNNEQHSITVSFFDIGKYSEYHFEDLFGYDACCLTENGALFAQSKSGQLHYKPHETMHSNWTKLIPMQRGEKITSIAATPKRVFIGTSFGYLRTFNEYGVPLAIEKTIPIVALTAQDFKVFIVHYSLYHGVSYSLFEQSSTINKYYQRESPLPIALPQGDPDVDEEFDTKFSNFNPIGVKSLFFSNFGDPCIFGNDNVLLVLNKWRSNLESRWVPMLDTDMEVWKMAGGKKDTDVHVWPLGLNFDTMNCILVKGKHAWPEFPLPLPSEMEVRMPVLVKSQLLAEQEKKEEQQYDEDANKNEDKELTVPVNLAAEEESLRSKVLSDLLTDTLADSGEIYGNEQEILTALSGAYDKAILRLFAVACSDQNADKALSLVQELKQDRALNAAVKISERAEMMGLVKKINDMREARFDQQMNNM